MKSFWKILVCALAGLVLASPAQAQETSPEWEIDMDHSTVGFRIRHIVGQVPGVFARFSGEVEFDPGAPERSQFYILVDSASVHTGVPERDEHLRSPDFLDVERFPRIIFSSKRVFREDGDTLIVVGDLTIRDVTSEVRVPVRVLGVAEHPFKDKMPDTKVLGLHAAFSINRLEFHVGEAKWTQMGVMGETIDLTIDMELLQR
jgi:polyisoprenoid-binding protein YceI